VYGELLIFLAIILILSPNPLTPNSFKPDERLETIPESGYFWWKEVGKSCKS